jgi:hypothetical protein
MTSLAVGWCLLIAAVACAAPAASAAAAKAGPASIVAARAASPRVVAHDDELFAISCVPKKGCLAGGKWFNSKAKSTEPLAQTSTGTTWALHNPPIPKGSTVTAINGVSCVAGRPGVCLVVGQDGTLTASHDYAALWNWSKWTLLKPPDVPSSTLDQLDAVSCISAVQCVITGHYVSTRLFHGLASVLTWNGRSWAIGKVPAAPKSTDDWLYGVSCTSKSFCLAVGDYLTHGTGQPTLAASWNGKAWKLRHSQDPSPSNGNSLTGVSCISPRSCQAIGDYLTKVFAFHSLGESWNGTALTLRKTPDVTATEGSQLRGVSCLSAMFCMATGTLAARWNGTAWKQLAFPQASPILSITYGTSCVSKSNCTAAGDYTTEAGGFSLFVHWNGTSWSKQTGKNP